MHTYMYVNKHIHAHMHAHADSFQQDIYGRATVQSVLKTKGYSVTEDEVTSN